MYFIPYGHVQIKTKLNRENIERRIKEQLIPRRVISGFSRTTYKYFMGEINNVQFKMNRYTRRGNAFTPVIIGKIHDHAGYSIINITLRPDFLVSAFLLIILLSTTLPMLVIPLLPLFSPASSEYLQYLQSQPDGFFLQFALSLLWITVTGLSGFYLFIMIPFNIEAKKVLKYLTELLTTDSLVNLPNSK